MKREFVTWEEVENFVDHVVQRYGMFSFDGVYGLPRGGLVFAVMISHRMGIPMLSAPTPNCLIVDDVCDSGESLIHYVKNSSRREDESFNGTKFQFKGNVNSRANLPEPTEVSTGDVYYCNSQCFAWTGSKWALLGTSESSRLIICTMYYKANDLGIVPDFYEYIKTDKRVIFPWES